MLCAKLVMQCTIATAAIGSIGWGIGVAVLRPQSPQLAYFAVTYFTAFGFIFGLSAAYRIFITSNALGGRAPGFVEMLVYFILFTGVVFLNLWYLVHMAARTA